MPLPASAAGRLMQSVSAPVLRSKHTHARSLPESGEVVRMGHRTRSATLGSGAQQPRGAGSYGRTISEAGNDSGGGNVRLEPGDTVWVETPSDPALYALSSIDAVGNDGSCTVRPAHASGRS